MKNSVGVIAVTFAAKINGTVENQVFQANRTITLNSVTISATVTPMLQRIDFSSARKLSISAFVAKR